MYKVMCQMWNRVTENVFFNRFRIYILVEELSPHEIYYSSMKFSQAASCVNLHILTWLSTQENFIEFCCHKTSRLIYTTVALKTQGNNVGTYT